MRINSKKIILISVTVIVVLLAIFIIIKGIKIGNFELKGIIGIVEKNTEIDNKNSQLATEASTTYNSKIVTLEATAKELKNTKQEYENEQILVSNSGGTAYFSTTEKYEIEFLWTKLGNYAGDEGVDIKIDVKNSTISGKYDLNFTVTGSYVGITDYIYDIENDSKLGFKIEDFAMQSSSGSSNKSTNDIDSTAEFVQATFSCKQININITQAETVTTETNDIELNDSTNTIVDNTTNNINNTTSSTNNNNQNTSSQNIIDQY